MMKSAIFTITLVLAVSLGGQDGRTQDDATANAIRSGALFRQEMTRIASVLPSVWQQELITSIQQTFPDPARIAEIKQWTVTVEPNYCNLVPRIDVPRKTIIIGPTFLVLLMYHSQAIVYNMKGAEYFSSAQKIIEYTTNEIGRVYHEIYKISVSGGDCGASLVHLMNMGSYFGMSDEQYIALQSRSFENDEMRKTGDYVAGLGIVFVVLHEAGHVWFGTHETNDAPGQEQQADDFAMDILGRQGMPPVMAITGLSMMDQAETIDRPIGIAPQDRFKCRVFNLIKRDARAGQRIISPDLEMYADSLQKILTAWRSRYDGSGCR